MTALRWGILGTGWVANAFVRDLKAAGMHVTAVCSRSQVRATAFAAEHDIPMAFGSQRAFLDAPTVDIVYVASPHTEHAGEALAAIRAGKHALVEKPFATSVEDTLAVIAAAEKHGVFALEAMWTRDLPHIRRIDQIIEDGVIGDPRLLIADTVEFVSDDPVHRINQVALGGGAILDLGVYPVWFAIHLFGEPSRVLSDSVIGATGVATQSGLILRHETGRQTVLSTASNLPGGPRATIVGTKGRIEIDSYWYCNSSFTVYDSAGAVVEWFTKSGRTRGMEHMAAEVESIVTSNNLPRATVRNTESLQTAHVVETVLSSAREASTEPDVLERA